MADAPYFIYTSAGDIPISPSFFPQNALLPPSLVLRFPLQSVRHLFLRWSWWYADLAKALVLALFRMRELGSRSLRSRGKLAAAKEVEKKKREEAKAAAASRVQAKLEAKKGQGKGKGKGK